MKIRCVHCRERFEIDDAQSLDALECSLCGGAINLLGDTAVDPRRDTTDTTGMDPDETGRLSPPGRQTTIPELLQSTARPATDKTRRRDDGTQRADNDLGETQGETVDYRLEPSGQTGKPTTDRLGPFELIELIGSGAFGSVWKARNTDLDRLVAVKVPRGWRMDAKEIEQFLREARAAAQLKHPNIVGIHNVGREDDVVYIVSDLIVGTTMQEWSKAKVRTPQEIVRVCVAIAQALHHAHEAGVVHRDLKPANILIDEEDVPFITDFGLAKRDAGELTMTTEGQIVGSPAYMSPEQARGLSHQADRRSDVYSFGVVLYNLLTGELPFRGNFSMLIHQIVVDEAPSLRRLNNHVPRDLEVICLKCLQKEPEKRYPTAAEVAEDLVRWQNNEPIQARPVSRTEKVIRFCRRKPLIAGLFGSTVLATVVAIAALIIGITSVARKHDESQENLFNAEVRRTRLARQSLEAGHKKEALDAISRALSIRSSSVLRDELTRVLDLVELTQQQKILPPNWKDSSQSLFRFRGRKRLVVMVPDQPPVEINLSGELVKRYDVIGALTTPLAVSNDGRYIAGVNRKSRALEVWDLERESRVADTGKEQFANRVPSCMAFSADASRLVTVHQIQRPDAKTKNARSINIVQQLDTKSGSWLALKTEIEGRKCESVRYSPDNQHLAAMAGLTRCVVWNAGQTKVQVLSLIDSFHHLPFGVKPNLLAFSPDSRWLAVACPDGTIKMWMVSDALAGLKPFAIVPAHDDMVQAVVFTKDNRLLVSKSQYEVRVWDAHSRRLKVQQATQHRSFAIVLGPDETFVTGGDGGLVQWEYELPLSKTYHIREQGEGMAPSLITSLQFAPRRDRLALMAKSSCATIEYQRRQSAVSYIPVDVAAHSFAFDSRKEVLWCGGSTPFMPGLSTVDLKANRQTTFVKSKRILDLVMTGELITVEEQAASEEEAVLLHFRRGEKEIAKLKLAAKVIEFGRSTGSKSRWSIRAGQLQMDRNANRVAVLRSKPQAGVVSVFDVRTQRELYSSKPDVTHFAFSADGARLVTLHDHQMACLDVDTGERRCSAEVSKVRAVAISSDGQLVATASFDQPFADIWDGNSGQKLARVWVDAKTLMSVSINPQSTWMALGSTDSSVTLVPIKRLFDKLREYGL